MTGFSFIHAADLHLGSPFRGLSLKDEAVARRLSEASRAAFTELVGRAIEAEVAFFVIAGDVYDGEWRDNTIGLYFNRELARLERAGIEVFLLRGNHDAASVVTRSITLPASVRQFPTEAPSTFRIESLQVALHGQGFAERAVTEDLAANYPGPVPGWFNIGVLHTGLTGRPPHDNYAPTTPANLKARGYDYWALGHVHAFEIVDRDPHIVFPGNLQGRNIRETGEKGAVLVGVEDGRVETVERLIVDQARWEEVIVEVSDLFSDAAVVRRVEEKLAPLADIDRLLALRVVLTGETIAHRELLARRLQLADEVQAAAHHVSGDVWLEKLDIRTRPMAAAKADEAALLPFDIGLLLDEIMADTALREKAAELIADIKVKIPGSIAAPDQALEGELDGLLAEARELLLAGMAREA